MRRYKIFKYMRYFSEVKMRDQFSIQETRVATNVLDKLLIVY